MKGQHGPARVHIGLLLLLAVVSSSFARPREPICANLAKWHSGDILFINGVSCRSRVVRLFEEVDTDYSHVGMVIVEPNGYFIIHADPDFGCVVKQRWEAVLSPTQVTGGAVYRLRNPDSAVIIAACKTAQRFADDHVPFDNDFDLSTPDRLYCTKLVWRAYREAGIDLREASTSKHKYLFPEELLRSGKLQVVDRF